jgi:hypothetical protein
MPVNDDDYRSILPQLPHSSQHLIHYDDSLAPRPVKRAWHSAIVQAFKQKIYLTRAEMEQIIGGGSVVARCRRVGLDIRTVGFGRHARYSLGAVN